MDVNELSDNESVASFEPDNEFVDQVTEQLFDLLITNRILVDVPQLLGW